MKKQKDTENAKRAAKLSRTRRLQIVMLKLGKMMLSQVDKVKVLAVVVSRLQCQPQGTIQGIYQFGPGAWSAL